MKNLTVAQKIAGGFSALILLTLLLGGLDMLTMRSVRNEATQMSTEFVPEAKLGADLNDTISRVQLAARTYGFTADEKYLQEVKSGFGEIAAGIAAVKTLGADHPQLVKLRAHLADIDTAFADYQAAFAETEARNRVVATGREKLNAAAAEFVTNLDKIIAGQNERLIQEVKAFAPAEKLLERHQKLTLVSEIRNGGNAARIAVFKAQALRSPSLIADALPEFDAMATRFATLKTLFKVPADIEELGRAHEAAAAYQAAMKEIMGSLIALDEVGKRRAAAGLRLDQLSADTALAGMQRTVNSAEASTSRLARASLTTQIMVGLAVVLGIVVAAFIVRGIARVLRATADSLTAGATQLASAASQVSGASQSLAAGASQQAASLEETSATIEELSSMTKRNAQSAAQARAVTHAARTSADASAASVARLNHAMSELKGSSSEIAKIVKTIDEIAFQTNILALNAAVEAARAGESGMGFAVVAEEVRALAQRSATAARETGGKIDAALARTEDGARLSAEVSGNLSGIVEQVRSLDSLIASIAQASAEQAQGIEQVNTAVAQIDQVTQSNAAAAEESAGAAEEMNAQTVELNHLVGNLLVLVGGRRSTDPLGTPGEPLPGGQRDRDPASEVPPVTGSAPASGELSFR